MRIDIISAVPELLSSPLEHSIIKNARNKQHVEVCIHNLRDYSQDKHRKVDDYPFGGGAGMLLTPQPVFDCINKLKGERKYDEVIFMTPDAPVFAQQDANRLSLTENLIILCGHYKGIDQRIREELITAEFSIGDYVLSGGELAALVLTDAIVRLIPGVLGDSESALTDSFMDGLLDAPHYTRPANFRGLEVPEVLRSGDHSKVAKWKTQQSEEKTKKLRPDLYDIYLNKQ
ncbi:MAG: tRNA (guanosine(37)-N1)-methyltransferase TrmD [Balneolales bacterium]|nr:tRNA (guanosine(37)-N1)-methyltransferase TrmD [Balneolales bacterium]